MSTRQQVRPDAEAPVAKNSFEEKGSHAIAKHSAHEQGNAKRAVNTRKRKRDNEELEQKGKRMHASSTAGPSKNDRSIALKDHLHQDVCEALRGAGIEDFDAFKDMADWDPDLAKDTLKNEVKLSIIQVGACLQLLRSKYMRGKHHKQTLMHSRNSKGRGRGISQPAKAGRSTRKYQVL